eukprot:CAMPEP_0119093844 /NCGR_PEP_ID=MMETSP1178-20130426/164325_1 /TAXON_ID=33656 /ORGANISM="unid sp, Strain CCMP2000" /LENGTH=120 /DNA_ID=CAMNT_0007077541 /DNA_START=91 /DNA_END=450 /DNA_ORIENTATION=+
MACTFVAYALAFYTGAKMLAADRAYAVAHFGALGCAHHKASCLLGGDVVVVFFCNLMGSFALGQAVPNRQAISYARGFAAKMFHTIDTRSAIDPSSSSGARLVATRGAVSLRDVYFAYPT